MIDRVAMAIKAPSSGTPRTTIDDFGRLRSMISLTYLSTAKAPFGDSELTQLLEDSRARNHAAGLTGMLLYAGGHFIQTLEGAPEVVDATYTRIEADPRHRDVFITLREEVDDRVYPDWSMGFEQLSADQAQHLPGFNDYLDTTDQGPRTGTVNRAGVFHRAFRDNMR